VRQRSRQRRNLTDGQEGFTIFELVLVMAGALTLAAIVGPTFSNLMDANRARVAVRQVERELQTARLKAVSAARSLRVRLDCPTVGQLRVLEVTGIPSTDNAANRCDPVAFPFPGPRDSLRATPSLDSPVMYLPEGATVTGTVRQFEFDPRGSVFAVDAMGATALLQGDVVLTVTHKTWIHMVRINAVGRISVD
jgi:Tfp pilus assembly protein FimT